MYLFCRRQAYLAASCTLIGIVFLSIASCERRSNEISSSGGNGTLHRVAKDKTLRVGYVNYPPLVFRDVSSEEMRGQFVATIEEIARQMDVKCEYHEATWSAFAAGLQNHEFDLSIAPTFATISRSKSVAFSRPLMYVGNSAIVKKGDARFHTLADLDKQGITIAVTQGEAGQEYAQASIKNARIEVLSQSDQSLAFSQVLAGRADIALGDAYATAQFAKAHPGEVTDLFAEDPYNLTAVCWAVRTDDAEFLQFINTAIDVLDSTGKLAEYERQYDAHWVHLRREWVLR